MVVTEKKLFAPPRTDSGYRIRTGERWYIEYYLQRYPGVLTRCRLYGGLNKIKDLEQRKIRAWQLISELQVKDLVPVPGRVTKIKSVLLDTLEANKALYRRKTYLGYKTRIKLFLVWLKDVSDHQVTESAARAFLMHLRAKKAPATVLGYQLALSSVYNTWNKSRNPFNGIKHVAPGSKSLMYYKEWQIKLIKDHVIISDPVLWLAIRLMYYCFIRPGEMRLLLVEDFNLEYGFVEMRAEISKNKKTEKVMIPAVFLEELRSMDIFNCRGDLYLFGHDGRPCSEPLAFNNLSTRHLNVLKALKMTGRYAFYSWKHTGVVKAYRAGIGLKDLQLQLRHHSLDMVNEYLKNLGVLDSDELRLQFPAL